MAPESIKKALGFPPKVDCVLPFAKHQKPLVKQRFEASEKVDQNTL